MIRLAVVLGSLAIVAGVGVRWSAAVLLVLTLAAPSLDGWHAWWFGEITREEVSIRAGPRSLDADLYRPRKGRDRLPGVLLVHGLSPAGRRQPDLARLAALLARQGQLVLVPQFESLAAFRITGREVDDIRASIAELERRGATVGVAGFSFGAGPALLAAADVDGLRWVGSFGGYADLENVITFIATGTHGFGTERHVGPVEDYNRWKLAAILTHFVDDAAGRERLLDVAPSQLHQRVPVIFGSRDEVERIERYHAEHDNGTDRPFVSPLFNERSLFSALA